MKYLTRTHWKEVTKRHQFLISSTLFVAILLIVLGQLLFFQSKLVEHTALEQAEQHAHALSQMQSLYTLTVSPPDQAKDSAEYSPTQTTIPNHSQFNHMLANRLEADNPQTTLRNFTLYPFPGLENDWPLDEFEFAAVDAFNGGERDKFYRFETTESGRILRYAIPQVMEQNCVTCHNSPPQSTKHDWQVGDVHGILAISLPVEGAWAQAEIGMLSITLTVVTLAAALAGLQIWSVQRSRRQRADMQRGVYERTAALTAANIQLERGIGERESAEKRLSAVLDTVGEGIITIDESCDIIMVNREANLIWGYDLGELMAEPLTRLIASQLTPIRNFMQMSDDSRLPDTLDERIEMIGIRKSGRKFPVELRFARTTIDDQNLFTLAARDITQRKQMENDLREERTMLADRVEARTLELRQANQELENASRMKDEFLAAMSHELRTPLNAILGLSEAMREEIYGDLDERMHRPLTLIGESGHHLLELINDILDVSKIEAGQLQLHKSTIGVRTVCEASLSMVRQAAKNKGIRLRFDFDPQIGLLMADELRLKQALVNLLSNAVKFTPENGAVGFQVHGDEINKQIHFVVVDTGIGIAEEDMERLFDAFVQLDSSLSRRFAGTGLGLALVKRLIGLHGGTIAVESKVGKGSRFIITMPWEEEEKALAAQPVDEQENMPISAEYTMNNFPIETNELSQDGVEPTLVLEGFRPRILLAEDNAVNVATVLDFLEYKGYSVIVAKDGIEAIERSHEQPNLILMDIQMPRMDGLEATRRIRTDPATADIPIVALTGLAMSGDREQCLAAGADDYLCKPFQLNELINTIEAQISINAPV